MLDSGGGDVKLELTVGEAEAPEMQMETRMRNAIKRRQRVRLAQYFPNRSENVLVSPPSMFKVIGWLVI